MAFSNVGVALVHALEYPVGGQRTARTGPGNGLLLPYVMRFNLPARRALRRHRAVAGRGRQGTERDRGGGKGIQAVEQLRRDIGIPCTCASWA